MKLPAMKNREWNYLALAFAFPLLMLTLILALMGCTPFGNYSLFSSDAWHQYYPFFKAFRRSVLDGNGLIYSWTGMGMDYLGLYAYYLASPLNWLGILLPESLLPAFFNFLIPVKLSLASLFFAVFLKKLFRKNDLSIVAFGCFYALCAWATGYQWNTMWLDTFTLLPLVALGTVQLLQDKKFILYTLCLFLSVFVNYYAGFFVCIFVLLVFICYQICRCSGWKRLFQDFFRIGIFTLLAIGMTAVLELPALAALGTTQSSVNKFPSGFSVNIVTGDAVTAAKNAWSTFNAAKKAGEGGLFPLWWQALLASVPPILDGMKTVAGQLNGGVTPTFKEGLPNLYCGVGTISFAFLFLTAKQVKLRDKLCSVFLLVFFALSFILRQLDYIWHGFHFPNMIPYRFSFLFSFVMLYMAYRAFLLRNSFKLWQLIIAGILHIGIFLCYESPTDSIYLFFNCIFFILYFGVLVYTWLANRLAAPEAPEQAHPIQQQRAYHKRIASFLLASVLFLEIAANAANAYTAFPKAGISNYPRGGKDVSAAVSYMQQQEDSLFYRAEVTHSQTLNDGSLIGYDGISAFTSSANVKVTEFMKFMGYAAKNTYNRYCFEEASPVSNLFLNLKYMLEREGNLEENNYFDPVFSSGNVTLLQNNAWLPLGFLADSALGDLEFTPAANAFAFQNALFTAATGIQESVWSVTPAGSLSILANNTNLTSQSTSGYCSYKNEAAKTELQYLYTMPREGFLCLDLSMSARNKYTVSINDRYLFAEEVGALAHTMGVCQVQPGDKIEIRITCKANETGNITIRAGILDESVFRQGYEILSASTLELTEFSNTKITGTIHCNRDGLLYTSIPQNGENWSVTVDGKPAQINLVGDTMIGVVLEEGYHTLAFTYENQALQKGLAVSIACLTIFAAIVFFTCFYPQIKRRGKYQR